eukprot:3144460-Amphidinium_carterae.1
MRALRMQQEAFVFDFDLACYRSWFHKAQLQVLGEQRYCPHSVRHAGPSVDVARNLRDITAVQARGMWRSPKSVQRYLKAGSLRKEELSVPLSAQGAAAAFSRTALRFLSQHPLVAT